MPAPTRGWILGLAILACSEAPAATESPARVRPSQVVPSLAASLTSNERFILPALATNPPGEIAESQARSIAQRYVRDMASSLTHSWSADHGADVAPIALIPCDRAVYAANPYESLTGPNVSEVTVRTFGPHWVVPLCKGGQPQVVVSFSSLAVELSEGVMDTSRLVPWARADVRSFGVPLGTSASAFTPEGAAVRAFSITGRRVSTIPELIMNPMPQSPVLVRWRVDLEAPVVLRGARSGVTRQLTSVMSGFGRTFKESGLLDFDSTGEPPNLEWTDAVTREPFTVVLRDRAPAAVELLSRTNRRN